MGKHEPMTAKAIGKRIKSKGLQKLKFYCQMCQKQCRDANGFKCHLTSEAHQRQLLLFGENPNRYLNDFSGEFMKDFLHLLKRRYSTKRVFANQVYQEYIKDRNHLHMNSTRWCTLTGFVQWMGRKGICQVDHTEKGWFITYIDRDPETLLRNEELAKKDKMAKDDDERQAKVIAEMIERGKRAAAKKGSDGDSGEEEEGEDDDHQKEQEEKRMLKKESEDQKIAFSLAPKKAVEKVATPLGLLSGGLKSIKPFGSKSSTSIVKKEEFDEDEATEVEIKPSVLNGLKRNVFDDDFGESKDAVKRSLSKSDDQSASKKQKKKSALDEIIEEQERWKAKRAAQQSSSSSSSSSSSKPSTSSWLLPDIVVRVVTKDLGAQYHQKKAVVLKTVGEYGAVIEMLTADRAKVKVDEAHLETVVPSKAGTAVLVLRGVYRGRKASIVSVDVERERLEVAVENADAGGRTVRLRFDDVSKLVS